MKKILSLILALAMALTLAVPAFAVDSNNEGKASGSSNIGGSVNNTATAYVMTIPAGTNEMNLTNKTSAQSIGSLKITRTSTDKTAGKAFNIYKKVSVTISSTNSGKLKNANTAITTNNELAYTLGVGSTNVTSWTNAPVQDFSASVIDAETAVAMTAKITGDYKTVADGTYKDVLTFNASVKSVTVTLTNSGGNLLSSDNLGEPSEEFTVSSGSVTETFVAYNSFISTSSESSCCDAKEFVAKLNNANYDDHNDWQLLGSHAMTSAWWDTFKNSVDMGNVYALCTSISTSDTRVDCPALGSNGVVWCSDFKNDFHEGKGFVVLRPVAN